MTCRLRIGCSTSKLRWRSERRDNNSRSLDRQIRACVAHTVAYASRVYFAFRVNACVQRKEYTRDAYATEKSAFRLHGLQECRSIRSCHPAGKRVPTAKTFRHPRLRSRDITLRRFRLGVRAFDDIRRLEPVVIPTEKKGQAFPIRADDRGERPAALVRSATPQRCAGRRTAHPGTLLPRLSARGAPRRVGSDEPVYARANRS